MARKILLCPTCRSPVPVPEALRPASFPFCCDRCKQADLGRWFAEEYVVPRPLGPDDHEAIQEVLEARLGEG